MAGKKYGCSLPAALPDDFKKNRSVGGIVLYSDACLSGVGGEHNKGHCFFYLFSLGICRIDPVL